MKKKVVISAVVAVVLIGAAVIVCLVLRANGLLGFYHPQQQAKEGQLKIACVGDSVTYGYGIKGWKQNNYPAQLQKMLGEGFCVNNFGYSGRTVQSTGDRPYTAEKLYRQSLDFEPDIVVFMLGSNDSKAFNWDKENFIRDYKELVQTYINLPNHPQVYVMAPPPVFEVNGKVKYQIEKDTIAQEIVPLTKETAEQLGVECIDLYSLFEGKNNLFSDGCHPTAAGATIIADTVRTVVFQNLTKEK